MKLLTGVPFNSAPTQIVLTAWPATSDPGGAIGLGLKVSWLYVGAAVTTLPPRTTSRRACRLRP